MTPLAQLIVRHNLLARPDRQEIPELQSSDCHCFEITEVMDLVDDLAFNFEWKTSDEKIFLPSVFTWIEWRTKNGRRGGLLRKENDDDSIYIDLVSYNGETFAFSKYPVALGKQDSGRFMIYDTTDDPNLEMEKEELFVHGRIFVSALSLINTPRIIGRNQHQPHSGLQRQIARSRRMIGRFPLQAWTEVILRVALPKEATGKPYETHLSGGKALHFCRAHLRMRLGKVEFVGAHWRGDPSIGIKRTRYSVSPGSISGPIGGRSKPHPSL